MDGGTAKTALRAVSLPLIAGVLAALAAQLFVALVLALNDVLLITPARRAGSAGPSLAIATILVPTLGGLLVGGLRHFAGAQVARGPADIIAAVQTRSDELSARAGWLSASSSLVSLGSGAAVGEYGPLVHIGGSLGATLARIFRSDVTTINITIACGVASAIATVFNAPIAGILFAHEIILRHFAPRAFAPVALASIIGYILANALSVRRPLLAVEQVGQPQLWEFGLFVLLGVVGAGLAILFMQAILGAGKAAAKIRRFEPLKPALAGLALGLAALVLPEILGMGFDLLRSVTAGELMPIGALVAIMAARLLATAMCLGMGFTGGVFSPALVIGSLLGAIFGLGMSQGLGLPVTDSAVYAICGMVAVTAPVIGAPVTAVVIVMELTGSYTLTLAALASVAISNSMVSRLFGRCLFDRQLRQRRIDLSAGRTKAILESRDIAPLVSANLAVVSQDATVAQAEKAMVDKHLDQVFLIDGNGLYQGSVQLKDVFSGVPEQAAIELRNRNDVVMLEHLNIWRAMQRLKRFDGESVAIVDERGKLVGALYASRLIRAYLDIQTDLRAEEQIRAE
ncbi:MAG: chloride channel protein [Wenzhouxiangellaceae bacterium]|nr:chloride channel protein [Wenzhouxiangellaceae bacterium]MBS3746025.1 chloride channel protein [Wenzhouxiangellaceae bacterium]MBS3822387.1 chloride channel protein [Wenzhouxiangellaceae bacterium]